MPTLDYKLLFLSYIQEDDKAIVGNDKLQKFMKQFLDIIEQRKYNNIIDNANNFSKQKYDTHTHKIGYNMQIRNAIINLVVTYLYSNLGKHFYDTISKAFKDKEEALINFLETMIFKKIHLPALSSDDSNH